MQPLQWVTEQRRVNDLLPLEINPRKISDAKKQELIDRLKKFNLVEIPAINADDTIISGHQRIKALQIIGRGNEFIDVRVPNRQLTDAEIKEYTLISNTHAGEWDFEILDIEFSDFKMEDFGIEVQAISDQITEPAAPTSDKKTINTSPYKKTHILLSFSPDKIMQLKPYLDEILKIEGIEYEQASN